MGEKKQPVLEAANLPLITEQEQPFKVQFHEVDMKDEPLPKDVLMRVRGRAHHSGRVTANGNLYDTDAYKNESERLKPLMDAGEVFMYPRHPKVEKMPDGRVRVEAMDPTESTGLLRSLEVLPDGWVMLEADIADTTKGGNLAKLIRMGAKVPISSRARGNARRVKLTDKHPAARLNPEWVGKEVNAIENFHLLTFDWVAEAASSGAASVDWREGKEEDQMDLDVTKLTDEQWKAVQESEKFKAVLGDAVKAESEKLRKEFEDETTKRVKEQVDELLNSEDFVKKVLAKAENKDDENEPAIHECPHCGGEYVEGMKFCPSCGRVVTEEKKPETQDEKDEAIKDLKKRNEDLEKKVNELVEKDSAREEAKKEAEKKEATDVAVKAKVEEALKGQPELVCSHVRAGLEKMALNEDNVDEAIEGEKARTMAFIENLGLKADALPAGEGKVGGEKPDEEKPKTSKAKQRQQSTLGNI